MSQTPDDQTAARLQEDAILKLNEAGGDLISIVQRREKRMFSLIQEFKEHEDPTVRELVSRIEHNLNCNIGKLDEFLEKRERARVELQEEEQYV